MRKVLLVHISSSGGCNTLVTMLNNGDLWLSILFHSRVFHPCLRSRLYSAQCPPLCSSNVRVCFHTMRSVNTVRNTFLKSALSILFRLLRFPLPRFQSPHHVFGDLRACVRAKRGILSSDNMLIKWAVKQ